MTITLQVGSGQTYTTIMSAWNAIPATINDHYVINIHDGIYTENFRTESKTQGAGGPYYITFRSNSDDYTKVSMRRSGEILELYAWYCKYKAITFDGYKTAYPGLTTNSDSHIYFDKCYFNCTTLNYEGIWLSQAGVRVYNCIIKGQIMIRYMNSITVQNCTIVCPSNAIYIYSPSWNGQTGTLTFKNNIFVSTASTGYLVRSEETSGSSINWDFSNNIWYRPNGSLTWQYKGSNYTSYATWQTASSELNSSEQDPKFKIAYTNLNLEWDSPAIDTGINFLSDYNYDIDNTVRPIGSGFDIGAYECDEVQPLSSDFRIGTTNRNSTMHGYIDEFRVSKGAMRFTSAFIPNKQPYDDKDKI